MPSQPHEVTVVIPTLGGPSLKPTIEALNRGTLVPAEILVCIPVAEAHRVRDLAWHNVKVLVTDCRGQVAQRAVGFRNASHGIVVQLDDDIALERGCLERLRTTLMALGTEAAVGPSLMRSSTGESVYRQPQRNPLLLKAYYWLMNGRAGYQPGRLDKSGSHVGFDPKHAEGTVLEVECLAGGCIMHHRKNLVLEDFYPFAGKAYYEDIVHSWHLRQKGISLKVDSMARCWLEPDPVADVGPIAYLRYLAVNLEHRKYVLRLYSRRSPRIYLFYVANYLSYLWKKLRSTGKSSQGGARPGI